MRSCHVRELGRVPYAEALALQSELVAQRKRGEIPDQLVLTDRGGDITYHGPGQLVGYPILDLRDWNRDVGAYVRTLEQVLIDTVADFGIRAGRLGKCTGVWVDGAKIAAIGVHISRWVTSHGFALNVNTDLSYFQYIVPCGLTKPVTSMAKLGARTTMEEVSQRLAEHFRRLFGVGATGELACTVAEERI